MCAHDPFPRSYGTVRVRENAEIAPSVYRLVTAKEAVTGPIADPVPGQFFMLRARPSGVLLGRPISVYTSQADSLTFLILKKGAGTAELCALRAGDSLDLVGPVGNRFLTPAELARDGLPPFDPSAAAAGIDPSLRVALIGGGIGIAPVAGFALTLPEKSFDFFASFRSTPYGLDGLAERARQLHITTEDGSAGVKGMASAVFQPSSYDLVYACGPTAMLVWLRSACMNGPAAWLSLEQRMACGAGACLGCTIRTASGNRRCCVDGPVFLASEVLF